MGLIILQNPKNKKVQLFFLKNEQKLKGNKVTFYHIVYIDEDVTVQQICNTYRMDIFSYNLNNKYLIYILYIN